MFTWVNSLSPRISMWTHFLRSRRLKDTSESNFSLMNKISCHLYILIRVQYDLSLNTSLCFFQFIDKHMTVMFSPNNRGKLFTLYDVLQSYRTLSTFLTVTQLWSTVQWRLEIVLFANFVTVIWFRQFYLIVLFISKSTEYTRTVETVFLIFTTLHCVSHVFSSTALCWLLLRGKRRRVKYGPFKYAPIFRSPLFSCCFFLWEGIHTHTRGEQCTAAEHCSHVLQSTPGRFFTALKSRWNSNFQSKQPTLFL